MKLERERSLKKNRKGDKFYFNWTLGEKRGNGAKAIFGEILAESFTKLWKDTDSEIQEVQP